MSRFFVAACALVLLAGLHAPGARAQTPADLPARPAPFKFVNDQADLMAPADAKKLESGLRRYADNTGTQVVVVTVPTLGGREVGDYGQALGEAWGVGQKDKNNGMVVLISAKERKVTIQPGSGLASTITPAVTSQVISEMAPSFKQGNYFAGLRTGLNTLMAKANPDSAPKNAQVADAASAGAVGAGAAGSSLSNEASNDASNPGMASNAATNEPVMNQPVREPESSGPGMMTLLIGAAIIGGILWFLLKMFRNRSAANNPANNPNSGNVGPNFLPNQPNGPQGNPGNNTPNFLPNRPNGPQGNYGPGQQGNYGNQNAGGMMGSGGMGIGGMLATGAAAAAGAYLGNRMASGHDTSGNGLNNEGSGQHNLDPNTSAGAAGLGAGAAGGSDYFANRDGGADTGASPDYFSDAATSADTSNDYFSDDSSSSYDDSSSGDTGGGGFDSDNGSSGSF